VLLYLYSDVIDITTHQFIVVPVMQHTLSQRMQMHYDVATPLLFLNIAIV
jgi:hypothetical protein